jgi:hypothetical protein
MKALLAVALAAGLSSTSFAYENQLQLTTNSNVLGVLQYRGGFANQLKFELAAPTMVRAFKLAIPTFCRNLEVFSAGTIDEDSTDAASRGEFFQTWLVNGGTGMPVNAIWAQINGPLDTQCDIPVVNAEDELPQQPDQPDLPPDQSGEPPPAGIAGLWTDIRNSGSWFNISVHGELSTNVGITNTVTGTSAPIVVTHTHFSQSNPLRFNGEGYADLYAVNRFGVSAWCRSTIRLEMHFYSGRPGGFADLTYPAHVVLDDYGRCMFGPRAAVTRYDIVRR